MPRNLEIIRNISGKEKQIFFLRSTCIYSYIPNSIGNSKILSKTRQQGFNHRQLSPNFAKELRRILFELLFKIEKNRSEIILNLRALSKILEDKNEIIACQILQRIIVSGFISSRNLWNFTCEFELVWKTRTTDLKITRYLVEIHEFHRE